jgi:diadenosine tetraphosphate (Ap4A) HIT family hydrolase
MQCPFCPPTLNPAQVILKNSTCLFTQVSEPVLLGSGVIIPIQHRETLFDLTADEWQATFTLLNQIKTMLDKQYASDGYNIGWNCGEAGGQEVFHAHLHVIPRFKDEPFAGKGIRYWIKQDANKRQRT